MPRYVIVPVVEGHGEVKAVPILIRRWLRHRNFHRHFDLHIDGPVRAAGKGALKVAHNADDELGIEHYVELAALRRPDVILVILDADDDCPSQQAPQLLARARNVMPAGFPIGVVIANRMYETWFLAAIPSKSFREGIERQGYTLSSRSLPAGTALEALQDCKGRVAQLIGVKPYQPTIHQPALTEHLPFTPGMANRSRSFRKLLKELDSLLGQARHNR